MVSALEARARKLLHLKHKELKEVLLHETRSHHHRVLALSNQQVRLPVTRLMLSKHI
jgi:hypothetical protein